MLSLKSSVLRYLSPFLFKYIIMLLIAFVTLYIRNLDSLMNPIMYTEDAKWLGIAFSKGWIHTFIYAKEGYFVWLNLIFLFISEKISYLVSGSEILNLPYTISFVSFSFYSFVPTFTFFITKNILNIYLRWLLFFAIIFLPMGDSSNEIFGRLSNIGYYIVFLATLFFYVRINVINYYKILIIDFILFIFFGTNPAVIILACLYLSYELFYRVNIKTFIVKNLSLIILLLIFILLLLTLSSKSGSSVTGSFNFDSIVEVSIARSILYPFIFASYHNLNDFITIIFGLLLIVFVTYSYISSYRSKKLRTLFNFAIISFFVFYILTLYMKQSLTQQLSGYVTTFPDRYFIGLNLLIIFIIILSFESLLHKRKAISCGGGIYLVLYYILNLNWIIEYNEPRMNIMKNLNWQETVCSTYFNNKNLHKELYFLDAYFYGWTMQVPTRFLNNDIIKNFCINDVNKYKIFKLTDSNWSNGLSKDKLILLLKKNAKNSKIKVLSEVEFSNNEIRKIVKINSISNKYLYLYIDLPISEIKSNTITISEGNK